MWRLVEGGGYSRAYRKSSIKAPLSNEPPSLISPPVQRRKVNKPPSLLSPPPPHAPPRILILHKKIKDERGLISYDLFRLEVHIAFGVRRHDLQLHMPYFLNFAL